MELVIHAIKLTSYSGFRISILRVSKMHKPSIVLLIGLIIGGSLVVVAKHEARELKKILESFAVGPDGASTGLTYDDYEAAYIYVKEKIAKKYLEERRQKSAKFRLFSDFVLTPMDRWRLSTDEDDTVKRAYVNRMEQSYKRFWPAYVEGKTINRRVRINPDKFFRFMDSLRKKNSAEPTMEMWRRAFEEYEVLKKKTDETARHEDIYADLDGYEDNMNFFNDYAVKFLIDYFADRLNGCKSDREMKSVIAAYRRLKHIKKDSRWSLDLTYEIVDQL